VSHHLIHAFLSWWGLALLAALDASIVFTFPIALDVIVVAMSSIHREYFWVCPIVATVGSLVGAASSIAVGRLVGEKGVERIVELELTAEEKAGLHKSAEAVKGLIDACKKLEPKLS